nr:MAG TPA: hypothetical protein [Caudoviricetes sp.]
MLILIILSLFSPIFCIFGDVFNYQTRCKDKQNVDINKSFGDIFINRM